MWLKPALIKARQGRNSFTKRPKKLVGQPFLVVLTQVYRKGFFKNFFFLFIVLVKFFVKPFWLPFSDFSGLSIFCVGTKFVLSRIEKAGKVSKKGRKSLPSSLFTWYRRTTQKIERLKKATKKA